MTSAAVLPLRSRENRASFSDLAERRAVYVEGLECAARIGVYKSEFGRTQQLSISVWLEVDTPVTPLNDDLEQVRDYARSRADIIDIVNQRHFGRQETLCDELAEHFLRCPDVLAVHVRSGKLEAFDDCTAVGCEVMRRKA
jgi:dihydroneopterin aldolase